MLSRDTSSNRSFSIVLIVLFMVFAMPTPLVETNISETARTVLTKGIENIASKVVIRKHIVPEGMRLAALFSALSFLLVAMIRATWGSLSETHLSFYPQIARRLTRLLLSPIKMTSVFV
ncbi:hypothetical protein K0T92_21215 [Paenibacillus oenotherae]|uniref:Uncharacterized protein n=1 Tax=Paenibacillus oenotherae TaxID=1435645 RepID=A0ABS7DBG6_9BACL|nr:hypothetical protein [Paenibacillus oenotherae]MBW7477241.1 hypothetical protein [Paenibacillus oenotherae]